MRNYIGCVALLPVIADLFHITVDELLRGERRAQADGAAEAQAAAIDALLHGEPIMMTKKTKAGDKEINILSYVQEAETTFRVQDGTILLHLVLAAGNTSNLNAEMLMTAIKEKTGLLREVNTTDCYEIMREEMLCADGSAFH